MHRAPIKSYRMLFGFFIVGLMVFIFYVWNGQLFQVVPPVRADHWVITSPGTYQYRQKITFNSSQIVGTLTNFPVLISISPPDSDNLRHTSSGGFVTNAVNGYDIVFASTDHAPVLLPFERTSYNSTTGAITAWVLVPSLSATTNEIYIYYGNSSVTTSQSNSTAVWGPMGANYTGVWHLDETSTCPVPAPGFLDSTDPTATGRHGTCVNSPAFYPNGQINGARDFAGTVSQGQGINIPSLTLNASFTYEAWVRPTSFTNPAFRVFMVNYAYTRWLGTNTIDLWWYPAPPNSFWDEIMGGGLNIFHYIAFTADSANTRYYHNTSSSEISPPLTFGQITDTFSIGYARQYPSNDEYFAGQIDEVRISNVARSANWLQTSYNNQFNQGVGTGKFILTLGSRQTGSRPLQPTLDELPSYPNRYTPATTPRLGTFSTTDVEGDPLEYEIQWDDDVGFGSPVAPMGGTQNSSNFATNGFSAATFPSGALGIFYDIEQTEPLADGVTYWWRVRAKDTGASASGLWSDYSVSRSITINTALPEEGWFQTTDAQFLTDTLTNAVTTGTGEVKIIGF